MAPVAYPRTPRACTTAWLGVGDRDLIGSTRSALAGGRQLPTAPRVPICYAPLRRGG